MLDDKDNLLRHLPLSNLTLAPLILKLICNIPFFFLFFLPSPAPISQPSFKTLMKEKIKGR